MKLRHVIRLNPSPSEIRNRPGDTPVVFVPMDAIEDGLGGMDTSMSRTLAEALSGGYRYFTEGDILLAKVTPCFENGKKAIARNLPYDIGFATSEVHVIRANSETVDRRYLLYLFSSEEFRFVAMRSMLGASGLRRVPGEAILNFRLPIPEVGVQRRIADFLDRETARIDDLVAKKERLLSLLDEKWLTLVNSAVTRGLNYQGPVKQVGLGFIEHVPCHWNLIKLAHAFEYIGSGTTPRSDDPRYYDGDIPWVNTSELRETIIMDTARKLSPLALADYPALRIYPVGTLLVAMYGATVGRLGILGVPAAVNQACLAFVGPRLLDTHFTFYWLLAMRSVLLAHAAGGGQPNLTQEYLRQLRVPAPSLAEQRGIARYLREVKGSFDRIKRTISDSVAKLRELRVSLISVAVTGRLDVDAWRRLGETERRIDELETRVTRA